MHVVQVRGHQLDATSEGGVVYWGVPPTLQPTLPLRCDAIYFYFFAVTLGRRYGRGFGNLIISIFEYLKSRP